MRRLKRLWPLNKKEIGDLNKSFILAAAISKLAEIEALKFHGDHGYFLSAFLKQSPLYS